MPLHFAIRNTPVLTYAACPDVNVQNEIVAYEFLYVLTQVQVSSSLTTSKIGKLLARRNLSIDLDLLHHVP
jgi:hypothetical protein